MESEVWGRAQRVKRATTALAEGATKRARAIRGHRHRTQHHHDHDVSDISVDASEEQLLLECLGRNFLRTPLSVRDLVDIQLSRDDGDCFDALTAMALLPRFEAQGLVKLSLDGQRNIVVTEIHRLKIEKLLGVTRTLSSKRQRPTSRMEEIQQFLSTRSFAESARFATGEEISEIVNTQTAVDKSLVKKFKSIDGTSIREFCDHGTAEQCIKATGAPEPCRRLHFQKTVRPHTEEGLGDCSYLNNCFHLDTCKYLHYIVAPADERRIKAEQEKQRQEAIARKSAALKARSDGIFTELDRADLRTYPAQWIQCDIRYLDMGVLGKFSVIMADPPWDIHMELPYGTMEDEEMRKLPIPNLQTDGYIFLWVTGRAMELGRQCLKLWGYKRCDELIWVKTNQLQRLIRTGRTGHWLNHAKEHCLVGSKGDLSHFNRGIDCDVLVAEVRETSHKPDEVYGLIERLSPGTRKLEIFGRQHNVQKNWVTLGNQLEGVHIVDPAMAQRFKDKYPEPLEVTQTKLLTGKTPEQLAAAQAAAAAVQAQQKQQQQQQ